MVLTMQLKSVHTGIPKNNTDLIPPEMMELEKREFKARVSQKQRDIMAAERLAMLRLQQDYINDQTSWWNKLRTMSEDEMNLMPLGFIKKYGSYITNMQRYDREFHLEENKMISSYFKQVKNLKKLQTDEEKGLMIEEFKHAFVPDEVKMESLERQDGDYMSRQPRVKPNELSYNFEQYQRYSKMLSRASRVDDAKSKKFYKIVKYVKKNIADEGNTIVRDFTVTKEFVPEMITIPEEF